MKYGSSRERAKRTSAAQLEEIVDLGVQVGGAPDAHRREARQRLAARRLDANAALDVRADAGVVVLGALAAAMATAVAHAAALDICSIVAAAGSFVSLREGEHQLGDGSRGARPAERP